MANLDRRAAMKEALARKTQESYEKRDDSGQFKNIFKDEFASKLWKCGEGEHIIDIIPFPAGNHDPNTKPGEPNYVLILWVHYGVGVNQDAYVCQARNYNKQCPICEYREEVRRQEDYDEELVKELTPKRRSIYNILCYDSEKEEGKGVQIFDAAHWFMEKHIAPLAKTPTRGAGKSTDMYVAFSDPDTGKSISFTRKGTKRNSEFLAHKFVDRNYVIPDEVLDAAFVLDECINYATYDEINQAFQGTGGGDIAPTEELPPPQPVVVPPAESRLRSRVAAPAAEPPTPAPAVNPTPTPRATPRVQTTAAPGTVGAQTCPVGGVFGEDCEKYNECAACPIWDDCSAEKDKLDAAKAEAPAAPTPRPTPAAPATPRPTPRPAATAAPAPAPATGPRRGLRPRG